MKRKTNFLFPALFFLMSLTFLQAENLQISGINEAQYVYKSAPDSLSNYFSNELYVYVDYDRLRMGMKFTGNYPAYSSQHTIKDLQPRDVSFEWEERFLIYQAGNLYLRVGNFSEFFGSGIVLRAFEDKNFEHNTKLDGFLMRTTQKLFNLKTLYGLRTDTKDIISGFDIESAPFFNMRVGGSLASFQTVRFDNLYSTRITGGPRLQYNRAFMDFYAEYAETKEYRSPLGEKEGRAFYSNLDLYINKFTITGAYKNYRDFDHIMNDLPSVNYSEEPLNERVFSGYDEEGLMGQVRFMPNFDNEFFISYSEAWNNDYSLRQSDLFLEYTLFRDSFIMTAEYSHVEFYDEDWKIWEKHLTPALNFDFNWHGLPIYLRNEFGYESSRKGNLTEIYYNPLLQADIAFKNFSVSVITQTQFQNWDDISDGPFWLGAEIITNILPGSQLKIFAGEEKGGKICRNGVCSYVSDFKGVRVDLTTNF